MERYKLPQHIRAEALQVLGYSEAEDKKSYETGIGVAFALAERYYIKIIEELENRNKNYEDAYEIARAEFRTVADILFRYKSDDI